jgi:butyryl-CoA dehydrogenase
VSGFDLTAEQEQLKAVAAKVAADVYAAPAARWDLERTSLPREEVARLADLGYLGLAIPEEYGGQGGTLVDALVVIEELAKVCRPAAFQVFECNTGPIRVIQFFGTEEQKQRWLTASCRGEQTMAIAISEPDAGSAATDLRTKARRDGDHWVINGAKRWISNGGHADSYLVYCRMSDQPGAKGIGAIVVPADTPGFSTGAQEKLMGFRGIPSADLFFDGRPRSPGPPGHRGGRLRQALRGLLDRAARQRDDEPSPRSGGAGQVHRPMSRNACSSVARS